MSIADEIYEMVKQLPPDKQAEVLDFAAKIEAGSQPATGQPRKSIIGALAHLNMDVSEEDIKEVRKEMWKNFPRDLTE